jgi:hypothetical protein
MPEPISQLQAEYAIFEVHRKDWYRTHANEFVVICQQEVAGFFPNYQEGLRAGLKTFGVTSQFLVKQVCAEEPVFVIY